MEHWPDARHLGVLLRGPRPPQLPPQRADVRSVVCLQGELHSALVPRRGGPREGIAAGQDAGRPMAKAANLRALLGWMWANPDKQILFMGGETRPVGGIGLRRQRGLAPPPVSRAFRRAGAGRRAQPLLPHGASVVGARLQLRWVPLVGCQRFRVERGVLRAILSGLHPRRRVHRQLLPGVQVRVRHRLPRGGPSGSSSTPTPSGSGARARRPWPTRSWRASACTASTTPSSSPSPRFAWSGCAEGQ